MRLRFPAPKTGVPLTCGMTSGQEADMTDVDGLWTAEGATLEGWPTSGIIMCFRNQVFGGGERYYCVGSYKLHGHTVEIDAHVHHYHGAAQSSLANSTPDFTVHYRGRVIAGSEIIEGEVYRAENPDLKLPVQLVRRAPLLG
jgi:hypothetical protein